MARSDPTAEGSRATPRGFRPLWTRPTRASKSSSRPGRPSRRRPYRASKMPTTIRRDPWRRTKVRAGRRTLRPDVLRNSYRGSREALDSVSPVFGRGKLLIPQRLERDGSPAAFRSPRPGSPGPPRSETSARGAFMEKGRLLEPKSPSGQNAGLRGTERGTEGGDSRL